MEVETAIAKVIVTMTLLMYLNHDSNCDLTHKIRDMANRMEVESAVAEAMVT